MNTLAWMRARWQTLGIPVPAWPVLGGRFFTQLAFGPLFALISVRLASEGFSPHIAATLQICSTFGLIAGAFICHRLIAWLRHIAAYAAFTWTVALGAILYAWLDPPTPWYAVAALTGLAAFGITVVVESWLQALSSNESRGRVMSLYMVIGQIATTIGFLLVDLFDSRSLLPYAILAGLLLIAPLPMLGARRYMPRVARPEFLNLAQLYRISPLGVTATFLSGATGSALFGLGPTYAAQQADLVEGAGLFMAAMMIGGLLSQFPVGHISDIGDRRRVLLAIYGAISLAAFGMVVAAQLSGTVLLIAVALLGAAALVAYPQAVAHVNDRLADNQRLSANRGLMAVFSLGLLVGPYPAAESMERLGPDGLYYYVAMIAVAACLYTLYRMRRRPAGSS